MNFIKQITAVLNDIDFVALTAFLTFVAVKGKKVYEWIDNKMDERDRVSRRTEILLLMKTNKEICRDKYLEYAVRGYNSYISELLLKNKIITKDDIIEI